MGQLDFFRSRRTYIPRRFKVRIYFGYEKQDILEGRYLGWVEGKQADRQRSGTGTVGA